MHQDICSMTMYEMLFRLQREQQQLKCSYLNVFQFLCMTHVITVHGRTASIHITALYVHLTTTAGTFQLHLHLARLRVTGAWSRVTDLSTRVTTHQLVHTQTHTVSQWGVPRRQPHRRSGLATLPSVGAIP